MAIEEILAAIADENDRTVESIAVEAEDRATQLLSAARDRAEAERQRLARSRDDAAALASARIVNRARLDAERKVRAAREGLYDEAHRRMLVRLAQVRNRPGYGELLARLLDEARSAFPDASRVEVDPRDLEVAGRVVAERAPGIDVEGSIEALGGLDLVSGDRRRVRNTLDSRAEKAESALRQLAVETIPELGGDR